MKRTCPNCDAKAPFWLAFECIRRARRIHCPACGYSFRLSQLTSVLRILTAFFSFLMAIAAVEVASGWVATKPTWVVICEFFGIFLVLVHAAWAGLTTFARFDAPLAPHCCAHCQYDLRSTSTNICPECGTPFRKPLN